MFGTFKSAFVFLLLALVLINCGGTGGTGTSTTGGIIAPASPPTCSSKDVVPAGVPQTDNSFALQAPNVIVPDSTVERSSDFGERAHTNHLIYTGPSQTRVSGGPKGLIPVQLYTAYNVPPSSGSGAIAVVDAYDYPTAKNDFNVFSNMFSLPTETSSDPTLASNTVFQVVYAAGTKPTTDGSWSEESAIDTQWAHAMAPGAKIYLVEAASASVVDLMAAINIAKALPGVKQVSLSFGSSESACQFVHYDANLIQPGVTFFAASGDSSDEKDFPSLSKNAVSIGGTTLVLDASNNRVSENSWSKSGSGLSSFEPRPGFQDIVVSDVQRYRGACDFAAVGDPATGVSVYDSTPYNGLSGWLVFGGTSVACPIVAGITNAAGSHFTSSQGLNANLYAYIATTNVYDVKHGTSGSHSAGTGWDYLTGVGSPNGLLPFQ